MPSTYLTALNRVASDAGTVSPPITALSISWGQCETNYSANELTAIDAAFANLTAAGVTVFAASGDSGAFDCGGSLGVDYPASSPYVIGVGGLTTNPASPSNPVESVWWDGSSGGGGGISVMEAQPSWQASAAPSAHRLVPDISLTADPNQGFFTICTANLSACGAAWCLAGGTSLASPLAAATLTDIQLDRGWATNGQAGLIQPALYDAQQSDVRFNTSAGSRGFRDILSGTNGSYSAGIGYDKASGLGAPNWTNLANWLYLGIDVVAPQYSTSRDVPITATATRSVSVSGAYSVGFSAGGGSAPAACPAPTSVSAPVTATVAQDGLQPIWVRYREVNGACIGGYAMTWVDTVAPAAAPTVSPAPNANGWNKSNVTVTWHWSDSGTGLNSGACASSTLGAGEGSAVAVAANCSDLAGNTGHGSSQVKVDKTLPSAVAALSMVSAGGTSANLSFGGSDNAGGSGIASYSVTLTRVGTAGDIVNRTLASATPFQATLVRGATYVETVSTLDRAGNRSTAKTARLTVPLAVSSFAYRLSWGATYALGSIANVRKGSAVYTATAGIAFTAKQYRLLITTCNYCGRAAIYLDGNYKTMINTYSATTKNLVVGYGVNFATAGRHTLVVKVLRTKVAASHGYSVILDGLTALN